MKKTGTFFLRHFLSIYLRGSMGCKKGGYCFKSKDVDILKKIVLEKSPNFIRFIPYLLSYISFMCYKDKLCTLHIVYVYLNKLISHFKKYLFIILLFLFF